MEEKGKTEKWNKKWNNSKRRHCRRQNLVLLKFMAFSFFNILRFDVENIVLKYIKGLRDWTYWRINPAVFSLQIWFMFLRFSKSDTSRQITTFSRRGCFMPKSLRTHKRMSASRRSRNFCASFEVMRHSMSVSF